MSAFKPFKEERPKTDQQTVEDLLLAGKSIDKEYLKEKELDIDSLPTIINRLKKKYPGNIVTTYRVNNKGKRISVYSFSMALHVQF